MRCLRTGVMGDGQWVIGSNNPSPITCHPNTLEEIVPLKDLHGLVGGVVEGFLRLLLVGEDLFDLTPEDRLHLGELGEEWPGVTVLRLRKGDLEILLGHAFGTVLGLL